VRSPEFAGDSLGSADAGGIAVVTKHYPLVRERYGNGPNDVRPIKANDVVGLRVSLLCPVCGTDVPPSGRRGPRRTGTVSAQARQLFDGLWEVVRARGLHQLAPELWAVMLVDANGHGKGLPLNRRGGELYGEDAIAGDLAEGLQKFLQERAAMLERTDPERASKLRTIATTSARWESRSLLT
jgi:hypothetical protein